jgi:hypothetical protein
VTIKGIRRLDETIIRLGGYGDNWHMTWAADDRQFLSLCDGKGWKNVEGYDEKLYHNSRVFVIHGDPPRPRFEYLPGYPDLLGLKPPDIGRYYGFAILALDGRIYQFLSAPNRLFSEPDPRFVGAKLIWSPDNGKTWQNQHGGPVSWEEWSTRNRQNMFFFDEPGESFSLLTFLQMGRNYQHNRDGYVYIYAPNGNLEGSMNQLALCRVPRQRILDRASYEFFTERHSDGTARWSGRIEDRGAVHTFSRGWVNTKVHPYAWHPSVVYYAPLRTYLMANWGMGTASDGEWFAKPSYLGFWTAPQPWGPWTQVHEDTSWTPGGDTGARCYQPQISPKWIAADGKSFWLVWTDYQQVNKKLPYYAFNLQKVEVTVA